MSVSRLLLLSLLIAVPALPVAAQSADSNRVDLVLIPSQRAELRPLDPARLEPDRLPLNQLGLPHFFPVKPRQPSQEDAFCFTMRSYKVARDDSHSDSTHPEGYSTCQRSTRFRLRSTEVRVLPATP